MPNLEPSARARNASRLLTISSTNGEGRPQAAFFSPRCTGRGTYIAAINASPNSLHLISVAPGISRAKS